MEPHFVLEKTGVFKVRTANLHGTIVLPVLCRILATKRKHDLYIETKYGFPKDIQQKVSNLKMEANETSYCCHQQLPAFAFLGVLLRWWNKSKFGLIVYTPIDALFFR